MHIGWRNRVVAVGEFRQYATCHIGWRPRENARYDVFFGVATKSVKIPIGVNRHTCIDEQTIGCVLRCAQNSAV